MSRNLELMEMAALALENGQDPLDHGFLAEHNVTLDECYNLADAMAAGLRFILIGYGQREER